jgi:hypothetical protein
MSYARLSRRPLLFKSFTGLGITEFLKYNRVSKEIVSKYYENVFPIGKKLSIWQLISSEVRVDS